jgi:hypothetical protein
MGRFYNYPIFSTTYNAGHKIFKRALTEVEMLEQHTNIPIVVDELPITNIDEAYIEFTIENQNMDGFLIRMSSMFPFNTENRTYKVRFLDTVKNLVTNAIVTSQIKTLSSIADVDTFNPYSTLPYDIIVTRDLYSDLFPLDTHEHKINVRLLNSDNSLVYQSPHSVTSSPIPTFELLPDIYTDWTTKKLRGKYGDVLDDIDVYRNKTDLAYARFFDLVDGDTVLVTTFINVHSQTTSGVLPSPLLNYDGDLSIVCHFLSLINDGLESLILTSINPNVNQASYFYSGWTVTVIDNQIQIRIGRLDGTDDIQILAGIIPIDPPYARQLHTIGFIYTANSGGISKLEAFWDGVSIGYASNTPKSLNWDTSNGIYFNRLNDTTVSGTTYNAGFKIFKKALTNAEMLEQHTDRPVLIDKRVIRYSGDTVLIASFQNVTYNGYILRIDELLPYNTDDRFYKIGFRIEVYDITTNVLVASSIENLQTKAETTNFSVNSLPYDIPITRALYPALFHTDIHEHRIVIQLQSDINGFLNESGLFISPHILNPPIIPNLLFDVNFNDSSLDVDYTMDDNPLVFEAPNGAITAEDGFVTMNGYNSYIKLTQGLPSYLKHTGDQSWVVNFRSDQTSAMRFLAHTAPPGPTRETTLDIRTGFFLFGYNNSMQVTLFKGINDTLVNVSATFQETDLSVKVNSAVFTYERLNHRLSIYFNGVFLSSITANPAFVDDEIDWSTADNIYVNKSIRFYAINPTYYHKISAYDKILTLEEIEEIYKNTVSLLEVNFLKNSQIRFQSLGKAESTVTTSSQSFTFNADNQFVTTASNVYLYIKPSKWETLVPAIQASSQLKMKLFIPSGSDFWKFFLRDVVSNSGFFIRLTGVSPDIELRYTLLQDPGDNGNSGQSYYAYTVIPDVMSIVPNLFDVEHEWRFEHKNLSGDPDGHVETEIYCDNVLLKREKINYSNTGEAQKAIGFNQETGPDSIYSIQLGQIGTKVSHFIINEKPI